MRGLRNPQGPQRALEGLQPSQRAARDPDPYLFLLCSLWISFVCTSSCFSSLLVDREFSSSCISMRDVWFSTCPGAGGALGWAVGSCHVPGVPRHQWQPPPTHPVHTGVLNQHHLGESPRF